MLVPDCRLSRIMHDPSDSMIFSRQNSTWLLFGILCANPSKWLGPEKEKAAEDSPVSTNSNFCVLMSI